MIISCHWWYNQKSPKCPKVSGGKQIQRLSTLRFIPCGSAVLRCLIHLLSFNFSRVVSMLYNWPITITAMSFTKCAMLFKSTTTGDSSVLWSAMSNRWPFILQWRGWPVSRTCWWPHLLHCIKYMRLEDLQEAFPFTLYHWPVVWLANSSLVFSIGQD